MDNEYKPVKTFTTLNWACGIIGLIIVCWATNFNGWAIFGTIIAGLHFKITRKI